MNKLKVFTFVILLSLVAFHIYAGGPLPTTSTSATSDDSKANTSGNNIASSTFTDALDQLQLRTLASSTANAYVATETSNRIASDSLYMPLAGQKTSTGNLSFADEYALELATGSAANLTLRFRSHPTTGEYFSGTAWSRYVEGVEVQRWTATQTTIFGNLTVASETTLASTSVATLTVGPGSLLLPSIHGPTAADGISFFPNYVRFSAAGANIADFVSNQIALRKDTTVSANLLVIGAVGVSIGTGTAAPAYALDIVDAANTRFVRLASSASAFANPIRHQVASTGYTVYQGNAFTFSAASTSVFLPLNAATNTFYLASGTIAYVDMIVAMKNTASAQQCVWKIHHTVCADGNAPFIIASSAIYADERNNADDADVNFVAGNPGNNIVASGCIRSVWQVLKLEIGGL